MVRCLVEMLAPYKGRVYDPACGSGGMFVQSEKFVESHGGKIGDIAIYGQESNATTRRLAIMSLAIRGLSDEPFINPIDELERSRVARLMAGPTVLGMMAHPSSIGFNAADWAPRVHGYFVRAHQLRRSTP
ncbi:hypothetical protein BH11GEM2_BH11GEM2_33910 [soil metagenome]